MKRKLLIALLLGWGALVLQACEEKYEEQKIEQKTTPTLNQPYRIGDVEGEWVLRGFQKPNTEKLTLDSLRSPNIHVPITIESRSAQTVYLWWTEGLGLNINMTLEVTRYFERRNETTMNWTNCPVISEKASGDYGRGFPELRSAMLGAYAYRIDTARGSQFLRFRIKTTNDGTDSWSPVFVRRR